MATASAPPTRQRVIVRSRHQATTPSRWKAANSSWL
jgi:hypothetical protein